VALVEMSGDRGRAVLVPAAVELFAQRDDLVLDGLDRAAGAVVRPPGPRL
jgi:hypothetical protein